MREEQLDQWRRSEQEMEMEADLCYAYLDVERVKERDGIYAGTEIELFYTCNPKLVENLLEEKYQT